MFKLLDDSIKEIFVWLTVAIVLFWFVYLTYVAYNNIMKEQQEKASIDGLAVTNVVNDSQVLVNKEVYEFIKKDFLVCYNWRDCLWSCLYTSLKETANPSAATYEACFDVCEVYN